MSTSPICNVSEGLNFMERLDQVDSVGASLNGREENIVGKIDVLDDLQPSNFSEQLPQFECKISEIRSSGDSAENSNLEFPQLDSFIRAESIDGTVNTRQAVTLENGKDDDCLNEPLSNDCFRNWQMASGDSVECFPDYIVYRDKYFTDSMVTFSSSCIKIERYGESETFVFQWGVDHIINIESHWCERFDYAMVKIQVISDGSVPTKHVHSNSGMEVIKFAIVEGWYEKQDEIMSMDVYKPLWSFVLNSDMQRDAKALLGDSTMSYSKNYFPTFDDSFEDVIYPKGDPDAVSISKRDVDLLQPDTFVNDTVIDFYIKYLKNKIEPGERHRFHFFNSFFFRKLADLDKNPSSALEGRAAFLRVRKWTRKVNLFEKDYIFVPVNFNYHWSLIVICHPGQVAGSQDPDARNSLNLSCILHMDSIRGSHSGLKGLLQSYLWEEWKERHKDTPEDVSSRFSNLRFFSLELPQQQNLYDCGLFLLHYVELFLEGNLVNFNPFKLSNFSNFLTASWFQPAEASLKRASIQRLIHDILGDGSCETSPDTKGDENFTSKCSRSVDENGTTLDFLSDRFGPSEALHESVPRSQAGQRLELTLLEASSVGSTQCVTNSGLVVRDSSEAGSAAKSFFQAFAHTTPSEEFKVAMPPMKEDEDSCKDIYCSSNATGLQQPTTITSEASDRTLSKESKEPSSDPVASIHQNLSAAIDSFEESTCASNGLLKLENTKDHTIGIDLSFEVKLDNHDPKSPSRDNLELSVELRACSFTDQMLNGHENESSKDLQDCDALENGFEASMQSTFDDLVSEPSVEHASKKRRLTPVEEEELPKSLDGELHI